MRTQLLYKNKGWLLDTETDFLETYTMREICYIQFLSSIYEYERRVSLKIGPPATYYCLSLTHSHDDVVCLPSSSTQQQQQQQSQPSTD
ncbi:hypothetical protein OAV88_03705 [bacterium]|nr:hypothetical protein [bacterium]